MYSSGLLAFSSFILALFLTPLVRNLARRLGIVDEPGDVRRLHSDAIPRLGGIAVFAAYLGAFGILFLVDFLAGRIVREAFPMVLRLAPAVLVVFAVGLMDDLRGLTPLQKFVGQLVAAVLVIWGGGVLVSGIAGWEAPLWLAVPLTLVWLVGCANAFNLIDGVDGLAVGVGLFATVTMVLVALMGDNVTLALATIPLAGALLGFLRFNFNPATIFVGDCGSLTIGFLLGCYGVLWSQKSATILGMTAPLMALAVPLLDTALSMARRFLRGRPIYEADRGHIHHRLLARGLTQRKVALLLYGAAAFGALLSVLQNALKDQYTGLVVVLFCVAAWIGVQHLGYVEFGVAGRMFVDGAIRRHLTSQLTLRAFEDALKAAATPEDCWSAIREACRKFGFTHAELQFNGHRFAETLVVSVSSEGWHVQWETVPPG